MKRQVVIVSVLLVFFAFSNVSATKIIDKKPTEKQIFQEFFRKDLPIPAEPEVCEVICRLIPEPTCKIKCLYTTTCVEIQGVSVKCNGDTIVLCSEECPPPEE